MIKIENIETCNWRAAIRGMRNPLESWGMSDSFFEDIRYGGYTSLAGEPMLGVPDHVQEVYLGANDLDLMQRLVKAGTDHSKFMRMITVSYDIVAPLYWWKEFDTYRIGVVRNSCSTMHKIEARELTIDDFATDMMTNGDLNMMEALITYINNLISLYKSSNNNDEKRVMHRRIVKLLPDSYLQRATITTNYQVLRNIRNSDRKHHKLTCWHEFCHFIDTLPYAKELLIKEEQQDVSKTAMFNKEEVNQTICECERCIDCTDFLYTSNPIIPYKLNVACRKYIKSFVTDIDDDVKPEDFNKIK